MRIQTMKFLVAALAIICCSCALPSSQSCNEPDGRCTIDQFTATDRPLVDKAWAEYVARGGKIVRAQARASLTRRNGSVYVFHEFIPRFPGGHFGVLIDEASGRIVEYWPGA